VNVTAIDHLNLRIPEDGVDTAVAFYGDRLGFPIEGLDAHRDGEQSFFDVRLAPDHVLHLWPTPEFEAPTGRGFNHVALIVDDEIAGIRRDLDDAGVEIDHEMDAPLGATGRAPAAYVDDPFGYRLEFKQRVEGTAD